MTVTFVGSGDAFGAGGRFQACFLVDAPSIHFAIDFGSTSLVALNKMVIPHNSIDAIVLSHIHGDHCGGIPFMLMDGMLGTKRIILTHMGPEMLDQADSVPEECAYDGLVVVV